MEDHSLIAAEPISLGAARKFYAVLLARPESDLTTALSWVEAGNIPLSLEDCAARLSEFAAAQGVQIAETESLLESLFALEGLRTALGWSATELIEFLGRNAKEADETLDETQQGRVRSALQRFFGATEQLEHTKKAQRIYDGLIPNFQRCYSVVEFRPIFNDARNEIQHGIISASLTLETRDKEALFEKRTFSFQLDSSDIKVLVKELSRLQQKIGKLVEFAGGQNIPLLNPSQSINP
jgi:hypothetical protein